MNARATKYGPEVIETIWALLCEGKGPTEIRRLLASDSAGLGRPVPMPKRTMADHVARLKRDRGDPRAHIVAGAETDAARAIERRALEAMSREQLALEARQKAGEPLSKADLEKLRTIAKTAGEIAKGREPVQSQQQRAGNARAAGSSALLAQLGKLAASSRPVPDAPTPTNGAGSSGGDD